MSINQTEFEFVSSRAPYSREPADRAGLDQWQNQPNHYLITLSDPRYPSRLKEIHDPPDFLFLRGDPEILNQPQIAVVGSRNPTPVGCEIAAEIAGQLTQRGFCITSGLALGIDAAAHRGALTAKGKTIAVLGCGLDRIYPHRHRQLATDITQSGALLSEFSPGTPPLAPHFPQRNRIISGLSLGTLVVEATPQSGSLITARQAVTQNREVFAIPGSIRNPLSRGCHQLIQQGAKLVESVDDIIAELGEWTRGNTVKPVQQALLPPLDPDQRNLIECIGSELTSMDQLVSRSQWPIQKVAAILLELELLGSIVAVPGGYIRTN